MKKAGAFSYEYLSAFLNLIISFIVAFGNVRNFAKYKYDRTNSY